MDTHHIQVDVRPLSEWPDEQVSLVYRLISGEVRELLRVPGADRRSSPTRAETPSSTGSRPCAAG